MEATAQSHSPATSSRLVDGAALGTIVGLVLVWLDAGLGGAVLAILVFTAIVWSLPSTTHLPGTAPATSPSAPHEAGDESLRGWIRARSAQGSLDAPFRDLAREATASLGRRVGVEELCAALERFDADRALRRARAGGLR